MRAISILIVVRQGIARHLASERINRARYVFRGHIDIDPSHAVVYISLDDFAFELRAQTRSQIGGVDIQIGERVAPLVNDGIVCVHEFLHAIEEPAILIGGKRVENLLRIGRRSLRLVVFRGFVRRRRTRARRILRRYITKTGVEGRLLRKADCPQRENQGGDNDAFGNQGNDRRSGNHAFASASLSLCLELRPRRS